MPELVPFSRVHVIGAGGSGMSGLAKLLAQCGHVVTGSDLKPGPMLRALAGAGVETWVGHRPQAIVRSDLVVASSAVPETDPEMAAARNAGIEVWARPRLLEEITTRLHAVGITGTHGKTTSSAMAVSAVRSLGGDPSFLVGGQLIALNTNAHLGRDALFILEADEAFGTFLGLSLDGLLITNIEADHLDHYGTVEAMEEAYADVAGRVGGPVVGCFDDPGVRALNEQLGSMIGYGHGDDAAWRIVASQPDGFGVRASIEGPSGEIEFTVPKPGDHIVANATGVIAFGAELGFDPQRLARGLGSFGGVRRRFETRARRGGIVVVDDYAHHPTEVAATIQAARLGHRGRLIAAFQPHRYSRTAEHGAAFGAALSDADAVFVSDVYAAGEAPIPGVTGRLVVDGIDGTEAVHYVPRRADLAHAIAAALEPNDMVLLLGAGDITQVADELAPLIPEL